MKPFNDETRRSRELEEELSGALSHIAPLIHACHNRLGAPLQPSDLAEVIQDTSLAAWSKRAQFNGDSDVDTWIYAIARNTILERLRRRTTGPRQTVLGEVGSEAPMHRGPGPGTQADTGVARVIREALDEEGTTVASICRARALEGQSFVQISRDLKLSESNVKARFYRSLPRLQQRLRSLWPHSPT